MCTLYYSSRPLPFGFDYFLEFEDHRRGYGALDVLSYRSGQFEFFYGRFNLQLSVPRWIANRIERRITRDAAGAWEFVWRDRRKLAV